MALPKNDLPTFTTTLPSTGQEVVYRPFRVKEQKNLMTSVDAEKKDIYRVMKECVDECTFNKLPIEQLPSFDIEYLFMQIRIMSVGETITVELTCPSCGHIDSDKISLKETKVLNLEKRNPKILFSDKLGVLMKYPSLEQIGMIEDSPDEDTVFNVIRDCVDQVFTDTDVYNRGDFTSEELKTWLEECTDDQIRKIEEFIVESPYLLCTKEHTCEKCGVKTDYSIKGIQAFFE